MKSLIALKDAGSISLEQFLKMSAEVSAPSPKLPSPAAEPPVKATETGKQDLLWAAGAVMLVAAVVYFLLGGQQAVCYKFWPEMDSVHPADRGLCAPRGFRVHSPKTRWILVFVISIVFGVPLAFVRKLVFVFVLKPFFVSPSKAAPGIAAERVAAKPPARPAKSPARARR